MKFATMTTTTLTCVSVAAITSSFVALVTEACSPIPRQNECVLSSLRVSSKSRYLQGTIDRYGERYSLEESTPVWIDLRTNAVLPLDQLDGDLTLVDSPTPSESSGYTLTASGSTVRISSIQDDGSSSVLTTFELVEAIYDPNVDTLSFFFRRETHELYVLYAKNNSYWGGVQVIRVFLDTGNTDTIVYPREDWNTKYGDAFWFDDGEIGYYQDLRTAVLYSSGASCSQPVAFYLDQYGSLQVRPWITPHGPVQYGATPKDHVVYQLDEWKSDEYYVIEGVKFSTGSVASRDKICKSAIDLAGGCSGGGDRGGGGRGGRGATRVLRRGRKHRC